MSLPPSDSPTNLLLLSVALFVAGAGVNGPKTMCGLEVRERFPGASGSSGALLGLLGQLGAAAAGYPLTRVHEAYGGWDGTSLAVLCYAALCFATRTVWCCPVPR
jgi:sugar phosphate permease